MSNVALNLDQMVDAVEEEIRWGPAIRESRDNIRAVINRVYRNLCRERAWPWLYRTAPLWVFPDVPVTNNQLQLVAAMGPRTFIVSENAFAGVLYAEEDAGLYQFWQSRLAGSELDLADRSLRASGDGNWAAAPFVIEHVSPSDTAVRIQLDPRCRIETITGDEGAYVIRSPRVQLPVDCAELLAVCNEDGIPLLAVPPANARGRMPIRAGSLSYVLEDGGAQLRTPPFVYPGVSADVSVVNADQTQFLYQRENWPVGDTITATTTSGGSGELPNGTRCRVFCSWWYANRFGPPSNIVEVETPSAGSNDHEINVVHPLLLSEDNTTIEYGRRIAFFMSEGEGAFYLMGFQTSHVDNEFDLLTRPTPTTGVEGNHEGLRRVRWDEVWPGGLYQYVRVWPTPDRAQRLELQYQARPRPLIEATDVPDFKADCELLVFLAAAEIVGQNGGDASRLVFQAEKYKRALIVRSEKQARYKVVRGQVDQAEPGVPFIDADIDYQGDL